MPPSGMQLEFATATDAGLDPHKRVNEDAFGQLDSGVGHLFVVCDGMGGHLGGKQASELAVKTIVDGVGATSPSEEPVRALVAAIQEAALRVFELGGPAQNPQRPGSTCVSMLFRAGYLEIAHVGDSRGYMIRGKQIQRVTRDHSFVQELIDSGRLTEKEAIGHPESNKITRALGMTPTVRVETRNEPLELFDGDVFILATDGLTDLAQNQDILVTALSYLKSGGLQTACNELVALANRRGGHDNITVQMVRVVRTGPKLISTHVDAPPAGRGPASATVVQGPPGHTAPGAPQSGDSNDALSPGLQAGPYTLVGGPSALPSYAAPPFGGQHGPPQNLAPASVGPNPLMNLVVAMAALIGLLVAALIWALKLR